MDFRDFEEAVAVVAHALQLREDLLLEAAATLEHVKALLLPEVEWIRKN
jgi:hypothetical protein